jgi:hypothetical protein
VKVRYPFRRSPHGAARVQARIKTVIDLLPSHPFIGGRTDDPTIRRLVVTPYPYLVLYEVGAGSDLDLAFEYIDELERDNEAMESFTDFQKHIDGRKRLLGSIKGRPASRHKTVHLWP